MEFWWGAPEGPLSRNINKFSNSKAQARWIGNLVGWFDWGEGFGCQITDACGVPPSMPRLYTFRQITSKRLQTYI